jgi:hypothetical protein
MVFEPSLAAFAVGSSRREPAAIEVNFAKFTWMIERDLQNAVGRVFSGEDKQDGPPHQIALVGIILVAHIFP